MQTQQILQITNNHLYTSRPKGKIESQSSRKPLMLFKILKHTIFFFTNTVVP